MTIAAHTTPIRTFAALAALWLASGLFTAAAAGVGQVTQAPKQNDAFRHAVRQQQLRDQIRQRELQQQLHQGVSDNAKRPGAKNELLQRQLDQADQAQRQRDRAALQDLFDQQQAHSVLPRVIPPPVYAPAPARSGG
ncbi:hypothetical protein [Rhodanobacter lindaniclasticus]